MNCKNCGKPLTIPEENIAIGKNDYLCSVCRWQLKEKKKVNKKYLEKE